MVIISKFKNAYYNFMVLLLQRLLLFVYINLTSCVLRKSLIPLFLQPNYTLNFMFHKTYCSLIKVPIVNYSSWYQRQVVVMTLRTVVQSSIITQPHFNRRCIERLITAITPKVLMGQSLLWAYIHYVA